MARGSDTGATSVREEEEAENAESGCAIVWFRCDLRLADNLALSEAIASGRAVIGLFILDEESPGLRMRGAAQRWWLHHSLERLAAGLREKNVQLVLRRGAATDVLDALVEEAGAAAIHWNRRYDPPAMKLDAQIEARLAGRGLSVETYDGQLLHEPSRLRTGQGGPYKVYSPFWRALTKGPEPRSPLPAPKAAEKNARPVRSDRLSDWKLLPKKPDWARDFPDHWRPGEAGAQKQLEDFVAGAFDDYEKGRDQPGIEGTSRLSPHLALGEISPFQIWHAASRRPREVGAGDRTTFRKELAWREFSYHLLNHFPRMRNRNFNDRFDTFPWRTDRRGFDAWCRGQTGFPIVDAGMRQLWQTGWMHNRVRLVCASFLTKHLLIDWRDGEKWFWDTLVDADPASNTQNWQWVAGSGADAAPYFRVFNPVLQGRKFDPAGDYVRRFVPELEPLEARHIHEPWNHAEACEEAGIVLGETYPLPIVDHREARDRALAAYDRIKDAA